MSNDIFFGKNSLRFWYYRFKDSAYYSSTLILIIIITCVLLLFQFILPQLEQWFSIRSEIIATRERTETINDNIAYLNALDRNMLNAQVKTATTALPAEKHFGTIVNALNTAAFRSGVTFQDYSFQVGHVSATTSQFSDPQLKGVSPITLSVILNASVSETRQFLTEIAKLLPLSEVTAIDGADGSITVTIDFYYKNLPKVTLRDDQPIPRTVESGATMINKLASWQIPVVNTARQTTPTGSSSAIPLF